MSIRRLMTAVAAVALLCGIAVSVPGDAGAQNTSRVDTRFVQYVVDDYPVRLIALDTLDDGRIGGRLCAERLAWIAAARHQKAMFSEMKP